MKLPQSLSTPIIKVRPLIYGVSNLFVKDETKNPTHTFKDRLAFEMVRPLLDKLTKGEEPPITTFSSISYGNTAKAMGYYVAAVNKLAGKEVARAVVFMPSRLFGKNFGPDTDGRTVPAEMLIEDVKRTCTIIPIDLTEKTYRSEDLKEVAYEHGAVRGEFIDVTEGLDRPAYTNIIIEALEKQLDSIPEYIVVPFGAGVLCNEIIDYVTDRKLSTKVVPVSSGNPDTIAVMLYGPIWVDTKRLEKRGQAFTRHEPIDRKGRKRQQYLVYHVSDDDIRDALKELRKRGVTAEPSAASGIALLKNLKNIDPEFNSAKHTVLVINTGNVLLNYV